VIINSVATSSKGLSTHAQIYAQISEAAGAKVTAPDRITEWLRMGGTLEVILSNTPALAG